MSDEITISAAFLRRIPVYTKHGPNGRGDAGACDATCVKCEAERMIAALPPEDHSMSDPIKNWPKPSIISLHALQRYIQRWRPGYTLEEARTTLTDYLKTAQFEREEEGNAAPQAFWSIRIPMPLGEDHVELCYALLTVNHLGVVKTVHPRGVVLS